MSELRRYAAVALAARVLVVGLAMVSLRPGSLQASPQEGAPTASDPDGVSALSAGATAPVVQAVWKAQEFDFHYQSFTTFYSCSSLAEKIRRILVELGADPKTKVRVSGCESGSGIARMPLARIMTSSPVEATPEALADLQKTRPVRELAARVRNDQAKESELDKQFPAQWKPVSLSRGSLGLSPGDCELIEQIERKLLPRLAVRVVASDIRCTPNQLTLNQPKLEVEALAELPKADAVGAKAKKKKGKA